MVDDLSPLSKSATPKPWTEVISHCFEFSTQIWITKKETGILTRIHLYAVQKNPRRTTTTSKSEIVLRGLLFSHFFDCVLKIYYGFISVNSSFVIYNVKLALQKTLCCVVVMFMKLLV